MNAQHGIYALGTPEHCFLELDLVDGVDPIELVRAAAGLTGPPSTIGGVNVVVGFRPQLWEQVTGWVYRHDRDLTGFIDGTENPSLLEAAEVVAVPEGKPGAGSSVLLFQLWPHDTPAGRAPGRRAGKGDRPDQAGQHRAVRKGHARRLPCFAHRAGSERRWQSSRPKTKTTRRSSRSCGCLACVPSLDDDGGSTWPS